jgi:hypothetical protein
MAVNPKSLENLKPWGPGESPLGGRQTAGATIREWINTLSGQKLSTQQLRALSVDESIDYNKQLAALHMATGTERASLARYEPWLQGEKTLQDLEADGVDVRQIKKAKIGDKGGREIELHDRAGEAFDRIVEHTDGQAPQSGKLEVTGANGGPIETREVNRIDHDAFARAFEQFTRGQGLGGAGGDGLPQPLGAEEPPR